MHIRKYRYSNYIKYMQIYTDQFGFLQTGGLFFYLKMDKEAFDGWQEDQIPMDTIANIIYSIHRSHDILIHGIVLVGWWISKQDLKED